MDLWVVAAATGAGYVAKYWRNSTSKEIETSSESFSLDSIHGQSKSRNLLQQIRDQTNPLRRLAGTHDRDGFFLHEDDSNGVTSTTNGQRQVENNDNFNLLSLTSYPKVLADNERFLVIGNGMEEGKANHSDVSGLPKSSYHAKYVEPLESIESSLRARLYREYVEMEECVYESESASVVRPLLLTDGRRTISRANRDFKAENEMQLLSKKLKNDIRRLSRRSSPTRESLQPFHPQGLNGASLRFLLGISVGIVSAIFFSKREVENINEQLMKTQNLAHDLQEELELKNLFNLEEKPNEDLEALGRNEPQSPSGSAFVLYTEQELDAHNKHGSEEPDDQKAEKSKTISKIEAELVAELERLELNMRKSSFQTISDSIEQHPGLVAEVVHSDLKLDRVNGEANSLSDSDCDVKGTDLACDVRGTSSDHPDKINYAVSPRELSLRLHEVIQARLEEKVMELERALKNSQRRLHSLELESIVSWRGFHGEIESTCQESQSLTEEDNNDNDSSL